MRRTTLWIAGLAVLALAVPETRAQFLEPDVQVLTALGAEVPGDAYGFVAEAVGDLDGDGASEFVVGAPFNDAGGPNAGRAYLYSGRTGTLVHILTGEPGDTLGWAVAAAGDLNGDGTPDWVVGAAGATGGANGRVLAVSGADHAVLWSVGAATRTILGYDVNRAGDVNGDGFDDVIAGAPLDRSAGPAAGRIFLLSGVDGSTLWTFDGPAPVSLAGTAVSGIDDLDGDGVPEQVAAGYLAGSKGTGEAWVLDGADGTVVRTLSPNGTAGNFGDFFAHDAGDVDGDGVGDIYVGDYGDGASGSQWGRGYLFSGADGSKLHQWRGEQAGYSLGMGRGAGDVDGDGYDDVLLGSWLNGDGAFQGGQAVLVSGANGQVRRRFTGTEPLAQLGFDVVRLGDVNADGLVDWLITGSEVAYVVAGIELQAQGDTSLP